MLTLGAAAGGGSMGFIILIVVMFVGMYFLSIRPQKKQQQKRQEMLSAMNKGDKVVTLGGIKGVVASIDRASKEVVVDCDGIYLTFDLNFIRRAEPANKVSGATKDSAAKQPENTDNKDAEAETTEDAPKAETTDAPKDDAVAAKPEVKSEPESKEAPKTDDAVNDDTKDETK
ncbi:preprotein translocase subunit YajC [Companilactobacillus halodurans]|uniref:Preprotein translocase subunit YajC n=1 Tax=Companilactobacillus halodurans TaxID=2584183 RepID=A0A5P0ZRP0_9LACO|nr:preprotein translocase subunit YajC [Companilactobacillus halodurans]MQS76551.1 preprotein translocase subunit YajC [Companilactobacillus halodurans]MQS96933.1 preprotein translocase subunit YajC [Companilactobacillus halodurans]